jgi:hypothetical protein
VVDTIAATIRARLLAVSVAERIPGGPPPRLHDAALFVDRVQLVAECPGTRRWSAPVGSAAFHSGLDHVAAGHAAAVADGDQPVDRRTLPSGGHEEAGGSMTASTDLRHSERSCVDVARAMVPELASRAAGYDAAGAFPVEDFEHIRECGLLGLLVPEHLGGLGAEFAGYVEVAMALAEGNGATALLLNMHESVIGSLALTSDEMAAALGVPESFFAMRDRALADAAAGAFFAVAMSERGAGSRLSELATRYSTTASGFRITGSKTFCSGAGHADAYVVAARAAHDQGKVSQFLVPATTAGIELEETWDSLGMRATASHDVHFDVEVGPETLLGESKDWAFCSLRRCHSGWSPRTQRSTSAWRRP